jgi:hypothetical protein
VHARRKESQKEAGAARRPPRSTRLWRRRGRLLAVPLRTEAVPQRFLESAAGRLRGGLEAPVRANQAGQRRLQGRLSRQRRWLRRGGGRARRHRRLRRASTLRAAQRRRRAVVPPHLCGVCVGLGGGASGEVVRQSKASRQAAQPPMPSGGPLRPPHTPMHTPPPCSVKRAARGGAHASPPPGPRRAPACMMALSRSTTSSKVGRAAGSRAQHAPTSSAYAAYCPSSPAGSSSAAGSFRPEPLGAACTMLMICGDDRGGGGGSVWSMCAIRRA